MLLYIVCVVALDLYCSLLDVIAESKALGVAGVQIPQVAKVILSQVDTHTNNAICLARHDMAQGSTCKANWVHENSVLVPLHKFNACGVLYTHTQEVRMKRFRQSLEQVVGDLYSALDSLDVPLRTLLLSHIDYLHRYVYYIPAVPSI